MISLPSEHLSLQMKSDAALPERKTACCGEREVFTIAAATSTPPHPHPLSLFSTRIFPSSSSPRTRSLYSYSVLAPYSPNQPPADEALQNHLDYTRKRMGSRARERDVQRSLQWRFRMRITFEPEHFGLVDESAADGRTGTRRMGYSKRGSI